ncbi:MAG: hypothetical protein BEN19_00180 [Epulopiscium sp. Nuni2H_MBin003]|nr:MAG: hypothetical protein BEN19_00180 [Epulopiscium sp. Nuni2H_MBin003]
MLLEPGRLLGDRYTIISKIGAGATSIVYKAEDNRLKRFVAIKILKGELSIDKEFVKKFHGEALSVASLSHTNIVGVYDVGNDKELNYIVMEYIKGSTLKDLIGKEAPFTEQRTIDYAIQILTGLKEAHQKNIIHRDIKPQNIMVTEDGILKVTDFGIAKAVNTSTIVLNGDAYGSVHYFSPEQAKGRHSSETSDLYSCGIILFEMITKQLPFESDNHVTIAIKHINDPLPKPSIYNSYISSALEEVIIKATNKSTSMRFESADSMIFALQHAKTNPNTVLQNDDFLSQTILATPDEVNSDNLMTQGLYNESQSLEGNKEVLSTVSKWVAIVSGISVTLVLLAVIVLMFFFFKKPADGVVKSQEVPNLIGKTIEQAGEIAGESLFLVEQVGERETTTAKEGTIIEQMPDSNSTLVPNSTIQVVLAITPEDTSVKVPDVISLDNAKAQTLIEESGLLFTIERETSNYVEIGKVIDQHPKGNTTLNKGDVVELVVSLGAGQKYIIMPNLYGLSINNATSTLASYGLSLGDIDHEYSNTDDVGIVIYQSIPANRNIDPSTKIDISVSLGPEPVSIVDDLEETLEEILQEPEEEFNLDDIEQDIMIAIPKMYNIKLPEQLAEDETKTTVHVLVTFQSDEGERTMFDSVVDKDQFPYAISLTGQGEGTLVVYFDSQAWWKDPFKF